MILTACCADQIVLTYSSDVAKELTSEAPDYSVATFLNGMDEIVDDCSSTDEGGY
jgi:hypothetical protein